MFISSKKCFEIREGDQKLVIPKDYIGEIPDWAASHWLIQAAVRDGSVATPQSTADRALEQADKKAAGSAEEYDIRPEESPAEEVPEEEAESKPGRRPAREKA